MSEENKEIGIWGMCLEGEKFLSTFRNLIGLGVFLTLIAFSGIYLYALDQEREMAENCGFTDGKLKCACTSDAWNAYIQYQEDPLLLGGMQEQFPEYFNSTNRTKAKKMQEERYESAVNLEDLFNN